MSTEPTIDTTRPSIARIYDHWLGGTHNFPVDREAGKRVAQMLPFVMEALYINRWFIGYAGGKLSKAGITQFLDLGAGLPTEGSLHEAVPDTARVVYNDFDPDTVAYAQQILRDEHGDPRNVVYVQGQIEEIDPILIEAERFLDVRQPVAICMIAVAHFLSNDTLARAAERLYEWSAPGSILVLSSGEADLSNPSWGVSMRDYQQRTGTTLSFRSPNATEQLLHPWQPVDGGLKPFETYPEADFGTQVISVDRRGKLGYAGFFSR